MADTSRRSGSKRQTKLPVKGFTRTSRTPESLARSSATRSASPGCRAVWSHDSRKRARPAMACTGQMQRRGTAGASEEAADMVASVPPARRLTAAGAGPRLPPQNRQVFAAARRRNGNRVENTIARGPQGERNGPQSRGQNRRRDSGAVADGERWEMEFHRELLVRI